MRWPERDASAKCPAFVAEPVDTYELCGCDESAEDGHCMVCCQPYEDHGQDHGQEDETTWFTVLVVAFGIAAYIGFLVRLVTWINGI
jgi:hypothetical protein